jgi:hypothetical protein
VIGPVNPLFGIYMVQPHSILLVSDIGQHPPKDWIGRADSQCDLSVRLKNEEESHDGVMDDQRKYDSRKAGSTVVESIEAHD